MPMVTTSSITSGSACSKAYAEVLIDENRLNKVKVRMAEKVTPFPLVFSKIDNCFLHGDDSVALFFCGIITPTPKVCLRLRNSANYASKCSDVVVMA